MVVFFEGRCCGVIVVADLFRYYEEDLSNLSGNQYHHFLLLVSGFNLGLRIRSELLSRHVIIVRRRREIVDKSINICPTITRIQVFVLRGCVPCTHARHKVVTLNKNRPLEHSNSKLSSKRKMYLETEPTTDQALKELLLSVTVLMLCLYVLY